MPLSSLPADFLDDPAKALTSVGWSGHIAHLFTEPEECVPLLVPYFQAGLLAHERCVYVGFPTKVAALREGLERSGVAVAEAVEKGAFLFLDANESYLAEGLFDVNRLVEHWERFVHAAQAEGYRGIRFSAEMSWALEAPPSTPVLIEYESRLNFFLKTHPALLLCQYDRKRFPAETLLGVLRTHPLIVFENQVARNFYYVPPEEVLSPAPAEVQITRMLGALRAWETAQSELRLNEERFRRFFNLDLIGMSISSPTTEFLEINAKFSEMLGYSQAELLGRSWTDVTHPEDLHADLDLFQKVLAGEMDAYTIDKRFRRKDGAVVYGVISVHCLRRVDFSIEYFTCLALDITERTVGRQRLEEATELLKGHAARLFAVQEQERRHLARELHDEIGQTLTAAKLNLELVAPELTGLAQNRVTESVRMLDRLMSQVRQLSLDLRPPLLDELGLVPALRWLVDAQTSRAGIHGRFTSQVRCHTLRELEPAVITACFRIAQEAITNALRHADAKSVEMALELREGWLRLFVRDNGHGFEVAARQEHASRGGSLGLLNMRERALLVGGRLEIISEPGRGTELRAWFPLPEPSTPPAHAEAPSHTC